MVFDKDGNVKCISCGKLGRIKDFYYKATFDLTNNLQPIIYCPDCYKIRRQKNMTYKVISEYDGNDSFEVEASTFEDALVEALYQLGWNVSLIKEQK